MKDVDLDCIKTDRYGRSVCKVMATPSSAPRGPKTLDAGLAMVTVGMAWWYRAYSREQTAQKRGQYEFAETEAKRSTSGSGAMPTRCRRGTGEKPSAGTERASGRDRPGGEHLDRRQLEQTGRTK